MTVCLVCHEVLPRWCIMWCCQSGWIHYTHVYYFQLITCCMQHQFVHWDVRLDKMKSPGFHWTKSIRDAPRFVLVGHIDGLQADLGDIWVLRCGVRCTQKSGEIFWLLNIHIQGRMGHYYIEVPPSNICKYHPCKNDGHYVRQLYLQQQEMPTLRGISSPDREFRTLLIFHFYF